MIADVFDGYIHETAQCIMENYYPIGMFPDFQMRGLTERNPAWIPQIALAVHRALNVFAFVSYKFGLSEQSYILSDLRKQYEIEISPLGFNFNYKK